MSVPHPPTATESAHRLAGWGNQLFSAGNPRLLSGCLRYASAALAVAVGFGVRLASEAWIGPGLPTFITFYPLVMLVALVAGFGPGVAATVLTIVAVDAWILPSTGALAGSSPVGHLSLALFGGMGLFMSAQAAMYRRNREKAAAYDREAALRESEARYHGLFENMTEGFARYELIGDEQGRPVDWRVLEVNDAYTRHTGIGRQQIAGRRIGEVFPAAVSEYLPKFARVVQTREPLSFETYSKPTGRHMRVNVFPAGGNRFASTFEDITERKQAEEILQRERDLLQAANIELRAARRAAINVMDDALAARRQAEQVSVELRESEARYRALFNSMNEGFAVHEILVDADGQPTDYRFLELNPAFEQLTGLKRADVVGKTARQVLPNIESAWLQAFGRVALTGASVHLENYSADLGRHYEVFAYRPAPKQFAAVFVDVTVRKQAEAVLLRSRDELEQLVRTRAEALAESERKYRELVENANSIILRLTPEHAIIFFNEYAEAFFGYAKEEVFGKSIVGTIVPETDSEGRDLQSLMRDIVNRPELYPSGENEVMRKDGSRAWVYWSNRAIRDPQGQVVEILSVGADITERKRMQSEKARYQKRLSALAERLAASEERERWDISRYIHDTIIQNLSLVSMRMGTAQETLAKAGQDRELADLQSTRQLVDAAIAECRTVMSELTPALLYELGLVPALKELADMIRQRHGIRVTIEEQGQSKPIEAALLGLLFQSVRELIMNALKHAGPCEIHVGVVHAADGVRVRVQDNGKGFDPADMDGAGTQPGGFGLFNLRLRVEGIGGQVEIESAPGQGATASIYLPVSGLP